MSNTMTGKEVLRAIADGADPSEFEVLKVLPENHWVPFTSRMYYVHEMAAINAQFRRKPRTRVVNGFTVPAPIQEMPENDSFVFAIDLEEQNFVSKWNWYNIPKARLMLSRGLLFSTKEAAIANAKAMVGIDPNGDA